MMRRFSLNQKLMRRFSLSENSASTEQLRSLLLDACSRHELLSKLEKSEVLDLIKILIQEQFSEKRDHAEKTIRDLIEEISARLERQNHNED